MYQLSKLNDYNISKSILELYHLTSFNIKQYPGYLNWYYTKNIPRILNGNGESFFDVEAFQLKGLIFLKNDFFEKKICTLYIDEEYRKNGLGQKLLENAFKYLDTDKPKITIPEHKIKDFSKIIEYYNWKETNIIYDYYKKEIEFN